MLGEGRTYMLTHPWLATFPGIAIFFTTLGINLLGTGCATSSTRTSTDSRPLKPAHLRRCRARALAAAYLQ